MKPLIKAFICSVMWLLCLCSTASIYVSAEGETLSPSATEQTETVQEETEEKGYSKGVQIAGFLVIFTAAMGTTAFIVVRPKLKMLKEMKKQDH